MSENENKLVHAAIEIFIRYGFRRTTMGDIAKAAGLSRQTLYSSYSSKEKILAAAIEAMGKKTLADLEAHWLSAKTPQDILQDYCQHIVLAQFDMLKNMPDSEDLFSALFGPGEAALRQVQALYTEALATKLQDLAGGDADHLHNYAEFFVLASKGLKHVAEDKAVLEAQLNILVKATLTQI